MNTHSRWFFLDYDMGDVDSSSVLCQYVYAIIGVILCCSERRPIGMHKNRREMEVDGWKMSEMLPGNALPEPKARQ